MKFRKNFIGTEVGFSRSPHDSIVTQSFWPSVFYGRSWLLNMFSKDGLFRRYAMSIHEYHNKACRPLGNQTYMTKSNFSEVFISQALNWECPSMSLSYALLVMAKLQTSHIPAYLQTNSEIETRVLPIGVEPMTFRLSVRMLYH